MDNKLKKIFSSMMSVLLVLGMMQMPAYAEEETVIEEDVITEETEEVLPDEAAEEGTVLSEEEEEPEAVQEEGTEPEEIPAETSEEAEAYSIPELTQKLRLAIHPDKGYVTMRLYAPEDVYEQIRNETLYIVYTENTGFGDLKDLDAYTSVDMNNAGIQIEWREPADNHWGSYYDSTAQSYVYDLAISFTTRMSTDYEIAIALRTGDLPEQGEENASAMCCVYEMIPDGRYKLITDYYTFRTEDPLEETQVKITEVDVSNGYAYSGVSISFDNPLAEQIQRTGYLDGEGEVHWFAGASASEYIDGRYRSYSVLLNNGRTFTIRPLVRVQMSDDYDDYQDVIGEEVEITFVPFTKDLIVRQEGSGSAMFWADIVMTRYSMADTGMQPKLYYRKKGETDFKGPYGADFSTAGKVHIVVSGLESGEEYEYYVKVDARESFETSYVQTLWTDGTPEEPFTVAVGETRTLTESDFTDPLLYRYLVRKYGHSNTLTTGDLAAVTGLSMIWDKDQFERPLYSLGGIEYFGNLTFINAEGHDLTDLEVLRYLPNLKTVSVSNNRIDALPDLSGTSITDLDLAGNLLDADDLKEAYLPETLDRTPEQFIRSTLAAQRRKDFLFAGTYYGLNGKIPFFFAPGAQKTREFTAEISGNGKTITVQIPADEEEMHEFLLVNDLKEAGIVPEYGTHELTVALTDGFGYTYSRTCTAAFTEEPVFMQNAEANAGYSTSVKAELFGTYTTDQLTVEFIDKTDPEKTYPAESISASQLTATERYSDQGFSRISFSDKTTSVTFRTGSDLPAGTYSVRITAPDRTYTSGAVVTVHDVSEQFVISQASVESSAAGIGDMYVAVSVALSNGDPADIIPVLYKDGEQISEKPAVRITLQENGRFLYVLKKTGAAWEEDRVNGTIEIESVSGAEFLDIRTGTQFTYRSTSPAGRTGITFAAYNYKKEQFEIAFTSDVEENTPVSVAFSVYQSKEYVETASGSGTVNADHILALKLYTIDTQEEYTISRITRSRTVCSSESFTNDITGVPLMVQYCNNGAAVYPEEEGLFFINDPEQKYFDRLYAYGIPAADIIVEFWTEGSTRLIKTLSLKASPAENEQGWTYLFTAEDLEGLSADEIYSAKAYVNLTDITGTADGYFGVSDEPQGPVHPASVRLSESSLDLGIGEMHDLIAEVLPANAENKTVIWSSSDETVARVENGRVFALNEGTAVITAATEDGNKTAQCTLTVSRIDAESVSITGPDTVNVGELIDLDPVFVPANTTNRNVVWTSDDSSIAVVDEDGVVKGIKAGTAVITMTAEESGLSYAKQITVSQLVTKIRLSCYEETLYPDDEMVLEATVLPEDATNKNIIWSSDNEEVASVDENGVITGLKEGTAVITAASEDGNARARCTIKVTSNEFYPGIFIKGLEPSYTYTGTAIKPEIEVYDNAVFLTVEKLTPKTDYTVTYKNTTKAYTVADPDYPSAADKKKAPQIIIKSAGKGNYTGSKTVYFTIAPLDINDEQITVDELSVQTGPKPVSPVPVVYFNGKKLKASTDYIVDYNGWDQMESGDHAIRIQGINNFAGTREITVHAAPADLVSVARLTVTAKALKYEDLTEENFEEKVKAAITVKQGKTGLTIDKDYTIEGIFAEQRKAGSFTVTLEGKNDQVQGFYGKRTVTVRITGIALTDKKIKATVPSYTYTGDPQELENDFSIMYNKNPLAEGKDYTVESYSNNIKAGTASAVLKGLGNYSGTRKVTFRIIPVTYTKDSEDFDIEVSNAVYSKGGAIPEVSVFWNGYLLKPGTDYTLKYTNNKKADTTGKVKITFKGNFKGSDEEIFEIAKKNISAVSMTAKDLVYKKGKYQSVPVLKDTDGKTLKAGVDYEKNYVYTGDIIDGDAQTESEITVTVTGKGNYTGTASATYRILKPGKDISKLTFKIKDKEYIGSPVYLNDDDITIMQGKTKLDLADVSFMITDYKNNIRKGTASVTFRGTGEYGGEKTVKFKIKVRNILQNWFDGFGYLKLAGYNVSYMDNADVTIEFSEAKQRVETLKFTSWEDDQILDYNVNVIRVKPGSYVKINDALHGDTTYAYPFAYYDGHYEGYARGITISSGYASEWPTTVFNNGDVIGLFLVELKDSTTGTSTQYFIKVDQ